MTPKSTGQDRLASERKPAGPEEHDLVLGQAPTESADQPASAMATWGWLLSVVWLVFLIFPLLAVWSSDRSWLLKAVTTAAIVAFAMVFSHGFRNEHQRLLQEMDRKPGQGLPDETGKGPTAYTGRTHFGALLAIQVVTFVMMPLPSLGLLSFIVSFAVFHFTWRTALITFGLALLAAVVVPWAFEAYELMFMVVIVLSVGVATILIRLLDKQTAEHTTLRTSMAVTDERSRVARDVHDVLGHSLTVVILKAELCQRLLDSVEPEDESTRSTVDACRAQLAELRSVSRSALAEVRSTVGGLRAANLADEVTVARTVLADAGVSLLVTGDPGDVPELYRSTLAWVVREAVTNIVRHANASNCHIELGGNHSTSGRQATTTLLRLTDDGVGLGALDGLATDSLTVGNGLRGLRERVEASGAILWIGPATTEPDRPGTRIEIQTES